MTLNILYCSDNNYAPYLGISMTSLLENNKSADEIVIYAVLNGVSDENKEALKKQISLYDESRRLVIVNGDKWAEHLDALGLPRYRGSQTTNLRLFFTEYIEPSVKRLLYLDCDTLVVGELSELFSTDMEDSAAAAVLDSLSDGAYKRVIGFDEEDTYFNAGVLLFDIENWTRFNCQERIRKLIEQPKLALPNNDQDRLNILLKDQKKLVSPKYNFQTTHKVYDNKRYFKTYSGVAYYTSKEIDEARSAPAILHAYRFLGQFPWHENAVHPWRDEFLKYKKISQWANTSDVPNTKKIFAAERILYKILPSAIFLPLFRRMQISFFRKKAKSISKKRKGE